VITRYIAFITTLALTWCLHLTASTPHVAYGENLAAALTQLTEAHQSNAFHVDHISFDCDTTLLKHEFSHITGLKAPGFISGRHIEKACKRLLMKQRFSSIKVDFAHTSRGQGIHFSITSYWLVKKIELEGIWFGRDQYVNLYRLQPGDIFDANIHDESIKEIGHYLRDQGYLASTIRDEIEYHKSNKTLTIHIKLKKRRPYVIETTTLVIDDLEQQRRLKKNDNLNGIVDAITAKLHRSLEGRAYTKKRVLRILNKIRKALKKSGFINARFSVTRRAHPGTPHVSLVFKLLLKKRRLIILSGNNAFSNDVIRQEFIGNDLPEPLFSPDIIMQQALHEYYKHGYWHTHITVQPLGDVGHCLKIHEGPATFIKTVAVINRNTSIPEKSAHFIHAFLKNKICTQQVLETSLHHLKNFYIAHGYWDFAIIDTHFTRCSTKGMYDLSISVDKGVQRLWGGCAIKNFQNLEADEFFKRYRNPVQQNIAFDLNWLQEQRTFLTNYFHKQGYWYANIQPELTVLPLVSLHQTKIFVTWNIHPGTQVKFGRTIVRGVTNVDFDQLKRQFAFKEGADWDRKKLALTRSKLKKLDVFKTVQVQSHHLAQHCTDKPTIVTVVDDDPVELRARIGYFTNSKNVLFKHQSTPKIGASFIIKNPTNRADRLSTSGDWTNFERKFACDYHLPSPFGFSGMGACGIFANKYINPVEIRNSGAAYQGYNYGIYADIHDEYKEHYQWYIKVGNEWEKITRKQGNLKFDERLMHRILPYFLVEPRLTIDTLDSHSNTTKGSYTNVSVKLMVPEDKDTVSAKICFEQSLFYPVSDKCIVAGRVRLGHIFKDKFERILPIERFYLGGPYSVRGYEIDSLPPLGYSDEGQVTTIQGGGSMFNANLELRIPLYKAFGVVLFQDIGVLSQSGFLGLKDTWYPGSGFGFRYKTPIGSIRFDIGWKWKRRFPEDNKSLAWYLTIGEAF
jgi:outer membrane protein assembly factor BamA